MQVITLSSFSCFWGLRKDCALEDFPSQLAIVYHQLLNELLCLGSKAAMDFAFQFLFLPQMERERGSDAGSSCGHQVITLALRQEPCATREPTANAVQHSSFIRG